MANLIVFIINSILLGIGLAMDAFSVSIANAMADPGMSSRRKNLIAGTFGGFQFLMPMVGWICVHTVTEYFVAFKRYIPWIALILLVYIGGKMLFEGIKQQKTDSEEEQTRLRKRELLVQGIATSIDALSVGFTISEYTAVYAFAASLIIAVVTFIICIAGLKIGREFGLKLAGNASILGGLILIGIGIEIFVKGIV